MHANALFINQKIKEICIAYRLWDKKWLPRGKWQLLQRTFVALHRTGDTK